MIKKWSFIVVLLFWTIFYSSGYAQSRIGISSNAIFHDFYYPAIPEASIGVEGGFVFQQDHLFNSNKLRFHSELSLLNRWKSATNGELTQALIHLGLGYRLGSNKKISFEPVVGIYAKLLLQYNNFYDLGWEEESKFFTLGAYVKPQMNIEISKKLTCSIFASTRFDLSPTFVYRQSSDFSIRLFTLLSGIQLTYKLKGNTKNEK